MIPFNKPYLTGKEAHYMYQAVFDGHISGNGNFTKKCHAFFETEYQFPKCLLTTSCTDALEMAAILIDIQAGDEVIVPSFTFVSTANAFVLRGAKIVFADSSTDSPNIDAQQIESLITPKTKAIVPVHYAGAACDMDAIMALAEKYCLYVVEDAAQAIESFYKGKRLGSIGHLAAFSFHETKNITSGEGGMLVVNDKKLEGRAEIIWEKGTNRAEFFRGEVNKYGWVDVGSSFLPSDIIAAFLYAQLENLQAIQQKRKELWNIYFQFLKPIESEGFVQLPTFQDYATNNAHMFYLMCRNEIERNDLLLYLKQNGVYAVFHYLPLHESPYFEAKHDGRELPYCHEYSQSIVRLPFFYELTREQQRFICLQIANFFYSKAK